MCLEVQFLQGWTTDPLSTPTKTVQYGTMFFFRCAQRLTHKIQGQCLVEAHSGTSAAAQRQSFLEEVLLRQKEIRKGLTSRHLVGFYSVVFMLFTLSQAPDGK